MAYGGSYYCVAWSPIIFDLDDDGFNLTDADHGVNFDLNADGQRERIAWTSSAGADAWLCRDRNGDGVIGDGRELFGNFTPLANGRRAPNGFVALAEFDTPALGGNGDGQTTKVANQIIVALNIEAVAEALLFAAKAGADPAKARQAQGEPGADLP